MTPDGEFEKGFPAVAAVRQCGMRKGIAIEVTPADRVRLQSIIRDRNSPQKHVWRARIVLLTAAGAGTTAVMRAVGKGKTVIVALAGTLYARAG